MKKLFILFIIVCAAVYYGTSSGTPVDTTQASKTLSSLPSKGKEVKGEVDSFLSSFGLGDDDESEDRGPRKEGASISKFDLYLHFKDTTNALLRQEGYVPIEKIPLNLQEALVATEDKRYYEHGPIDFIGIGRAAFINMQSGETLEGGSTITQQVAKNMYLTQERTFTRKAEELILAILLEQHYSKKEILAMYLNSAYFGANAYGIAEASRIYFHTTPEKLTLGQCALLAGLPQAPSYLNPFDNYKGAREKQKLVLDLMVAQNYITKKQAKSAYDEELQFTE